MPENFDPSKGTVSRARATCPVCGYVVDDNTTRKLFQERKARERMIAVVLHKRGESGKRYRLATDKDVEVFKEAERYLEEKRLKLMKEWGIDPVPDEALPPKETLGFRVQRYGMLKWGDLFNSRQKLALITFTEKVRLAYKKMLEEGYDEEYAKAITTYLGLGVSRSVPFYSVLTRWEPMRETPANVFGRQALPMMWDFVDVNPFSGMAGSNEQNIDWILQVISHLSQIPPVDDD